MTSKLTLSAFLAAALLAPGCATTEPVPETKPTPPVAAAPVAPPAPPMPPTTPDAEFRAKKPDALASQGRFEAPVPKELKLKNGLQVLLYENHAVPLVGAELVIKTGADGNPIDKAGLAELHAAMLEEGTKHRSATQIAEQLENLAAVLSVNSTLDSTRIHLNALAETLPQALDLMADIAISPAFKQQDLDRVRKGYLTELAQRQAAPGFIASNTVARTLYGEKHPWGQPAGGTEAVISKLGPKDLSRFHDTYVVPPNAVLTVSGDIKLDELQGLLEKTFGNWKGKVPKKQKLPEPPKTVREILVVDHAGSQSRVSVGELMLTAADPDVVPMKTANYVLGGLFSSRLNMNLREDKAYSYGVFSGLSFNDRTGVFTSGGNIVAIHTPEAIVEMEKEYARFASGELTPEELNAAKSAYVRSLPSQLETNDAVASSLGTLALNGLPLDYYAKLPEQVNAVTAADIARVAKKYVTPEKWPVVVVGPYGQDKEKLEALKLGEVKVVQAPGSAPKK
jgi:zinc protease